MLSFEGMKVVQSSGRAHRRRFCEGVRALGRGFSIVHPLLVPASRGGRHFLEIGPGRTEARELLAREYGVDFRDPACPIELDAENEAGRDASGRPGDLDRDGGKPIQYADLGNERTVVLPGEAEDETCDATAPDHDVVRGRELSPCIRDSISAGSGKPARRIASSAMPIAASSRSSSSRTPRSPRPRSRIVWATRTLRTLGRPATAGSCAGRDRRTGTGDRATTPGSRARSPRCRSSPSRKSNVGRGLHGRAGPTLHLRPLELAAEDRLDDRLEAQARYVAGLTPVSNPGAE